MSLEEAIDTLAGIGLLVLLWLIAHSIVYALYGIYRRLRFLWWKWQFERDNKREREGQ